MPRCWLRFRTVSAKFPLADLSARGCIILGLLCVATGSMVCFFGAARVFMGYSPPQAITYFLAPSTSELCEPITDSLQQHIDKHGRYPVSLAAGGIKVPDTFFGPWEYRVDDDGQFCTLSVGDHGRYRFKVSWTPVGSWYIDT